MIWKKFQKTIEKNKLCNLFKEKRDKLLKTYQIYSSSKVSFLIPLIAISLYDSEFIKKLDTNSNLMSIKKGVIDIKSKSFRERRKDDYITKELELDLDFASIENIDKFCETHYNYKKENFDIDYKFELIDRINKNYEKTNNKKDIIKLKDIYEKFTKREFFYNFNKFQRRKYNYGYFIKILSGNTAIRPFYISIKIIVI